MNTKALAHSKSLFASVEPERYLRYVRLGSVEDCSPDWVTAGKSEKCVEAGLILVVGGNSCKNMSMGMSMFASAGSTE